MSHTQLHHAIMYLLCFRTRSMNVLLKSEHFRERIEQILKHPLSPLKVCLPSTVQEFLRQAKSARLFTVSETFVFDDLLESELFRAFGGLERLDMIFPFDPCLLRKSDRFIRPNFVYWSVVNDDEYGSSDDEDIVEYAKSNPLTCLTTNNGRLLQYRRPPFLHRAEGNVWFTITC